MKIAIVPSTAAMALAASIVLHGGAAHAVEAYSASGGSPAVAFNGGTVVAKLKVPPGTYFVSGNGIVRNMDSANAAYVECTILLKGVNRGIADILVPVAKDAGVPGGANWAFATTMVNASATAARVTVRCVNFGPAADAQVGGSYWNLVAIPLTSDRHKDNFP